MEEIPQPALSRPATDGWAFEPDETKNRIVRRFTEAFDDVWPEDVHRIYVMGTAGAGAGGRTTNTTGGAGGGGAGQSCLGYVDVTPGSRYSGVVGLGGIAPKYPGVLGAQNGGAGGSNTLYLEGRPAIRLDGGKGGVASGAGGAVAGPTTFTSLLGPLLIQGAAGGSGAAGIAGTAGGNTDTQRGGSGGNTGGGGGGGASLFGNGGAGGNSGVSAAAVGADEWGAGGGGSGADPTGVAQYNGADGTQGFWYFEYWTAEEDAS